MQKMRNLLLILSIAILLSGCSPFFNSGKALTLLVSVIGIVITVFGIRGLANSAQCDNVNSKLTQLTKEIKEHKNGN